MNRETTAKAEDADTTVYRLTNKKTGRRASNASWLLDLAAQAYERGDGQGIAALLPQAKAAELLKYNELRLVKPHKKKLKRDTYPTSHAELRQLAQRAIPAIAVYYLWHEFGLESQRSLFKKDFAKWIVTQIGDPASPLNRWLKKWPEIAAIAETNKAVTWWLEQIKNQSKSRQSIKSLSSVQCNEAQMDGKKHGHPNRSRASSPPTRDVAKSRLKKKHAL
jgi:hypothetical protein